jgi:hypothetical protein
VDRLERAGLDPTCTPATRLLSSAQAPVIVVVSGKVRLTVTSVMYGRGIPPADGDLDSLWLGSPLK